MKRDEHLLVILAEECSEVAKEAAKALRFGLDDKEPNQDLTNRKKIATEFNDLYAVMSMCLDAGILNDSDMLVATEMEAKKQKVEKYLKYSKSVGK
jgi:hypothetical protein